MLNISEILIKVLIKKKKVSYYQRDVSAVRSTGCSC